MMEYLGAFFDFEETRIWLEPRPANQINEILLLWLGLQQYLPDSFVRTKKR